jgi:LemA protein
MKKWVIIGAIVLVIFIFIGKLFSIYNTIIGLDEQVSSSWAQVENQLQRRNDLIPNLVNTVKGYAKHEREIFTKIAEARAKLAGAKTIPEKIKAAGELGGFLSRLLMIVERYPDLKANQTFAKMMDELAGTENRIAVERRRYNESVKRYNRYIRRFPGRLIAGVCNFEKAVYFEAEAGAEKVPEVKF